MIKTPECMRVYIGSFWEQPLRGSEWSRQLFEMEMRDLLTDLKNVPKNAAVRKVRGGAAAAVAAVAAVTVATAAVVAVRGLQLGGVSSCGWRGLPVSLAHFTHQRAISPASRPPLLPSPR